MAAGAVTAAAAGPSPVAGTTAWRALTGCCAGEAVSASSAVPAWAGMAIAATRPPEAARTAEPLATGVPAWVAIWLSSATGL